MLFRGFAAARPLILPSLAPAALVLVGVLAGVLALDSGWRAGYAHLSRVDVTKRDRVVAGQQVGLSGATGKVSGPHLHFEVRAPSGKLVDPRPYLQAGRRALKRWV